MKKRIKQIKSQLFKTISDIEKYKWMFCRNPEADFTRSRKLSFEDVVRFSLQTECESMNRELLTYLDFDKNGCCFFVQKSAKKYGKNKNSVYWMKKWQVENGKEKAKKIKNKKQKENRKRKRKAEICSVKKDEAAGDCWPVKPEGRLLADGRLCGLYEKMHGGRLPAKRRRYRS